MSKVSVAVSTNSTYFLGYVIKKTDYYTWQGTFFGYGTFSSAQIAWQWSPDGGTTFLAMKDLGGNAVVSTSNDSFNSDFCTGRNNTDRIALYAAVTSGTAGMSLTVGFYDNN